MTDRRDALVLFGATGDLAKKMLFPDLHQLAQSGRVVLEKPFGRDLASAGGLNRCVLDRYHFVDTDLDLPAAPPLP